MKIKWNTSAPPKRTTKPVTLRYKSDGMTPQIGLFSWYEPEGAFVECAEGPDNIALYPADGWVILGWR